MLRAYSVDRLAVLRKEEPESDAPDGFAGESYQPVDGKETTNRSSGDVLLGSEF